MKKLFINISRWYKIHNYYDFAYNDLYKNHWIKTILFFDKNIWHTEFLNQDSYDIFYYDSILDLKNQIFSINIENIYYINTFDEVLIDIVNSIKKDLWLWYTKYFDVFRNKYLQRELLLNNYPETTVKSIEIDLDNIEWFYNKLNFPYIIKPASWVQSSWVSLIKSKKELYDYVWIINDLNLKMIDRWVENNKYIIEEYILWDMYTVNYFVNDLGEVFYSPLVKVNSIQDLWIDDFSNYVRINWNIVNKEIDFNLVKDFVNKHVKAFWIKNTFIHHEFKLSNYWELKTIETNWRIWGYRLEMIQELYDFNLLSMPLSINSNMETDYNNSVFVLYPYKNWILKWFDKEIINKIKSLDSFFNIRLSENLIWKEVWLTKDWFGNIWAIKLKNKDINKFKSDFEFIENSYKNLVILK